MTHKKTIEEIQSHLPLKIKEVSWNPGFRDSYFQLSGPHWIFKTLSAWRITTVEKVLLGCYDSDSEKIINNIELQNCDIIKVTYQTNFLKMDPVFHLSNGLIMEFFAMSNYLPWTFETE